MEELLKMAAAALLLAVVMLYDWKINRNNAN